MQVQRRLERGQRELVDPQRARERMPPARGDRLRRPHEQARLRAAEELVAAEADDGRAGPPRAAHGRLAGQQLEVVVEDARAGVVDHRDAERAQLLDADLLDEADGAEVRLVRPQDGADAVPAVPAGGRVVGQPRAFGGAALYEPRPGLPDDLGDAEAAADL